MLRAAPVASCDRANGNTPGNVDETGASGGADANPARLPRLWASTLGGGRDSDLRC